MSTTTYQRTYLVCSFLFLFYLKALFLTTVSFLAKRCRLFATTLSQETMLLFTENDILLSQSYYNITFF